MVAGVNHLPLVTSLRIGDQDGFAMLRAAIDGEIDLTGGLWLDPPAAMHWKAADPEHGWTKADVLANNKVKFTLFDRFGVLPGSSDTHVVEFLRRSGPRSPGTTGASTLRHARAPFGQSNRRRRAGRAHGRQEIPRMPSGEFVASLIEGLVTGADRAFPANIPNRGQVETLPDDVVVGSMVVAGEGVRPRDRAPVPSFLGDHLRREGSPLRSTP